MFKTKSTYDSEPCNQMNRKLCEAWKCGQAAKNALRLSHNTLQILWNNVHHSLQLVVVPAYNHTIYINEHAPLHSLNSTMYYVTQTSCTHHNGNAFCVFLGDHASEPWSVLQLFHMPFENQSKNVSAHTHSRTPAHRTAFWWPASFTLNHSI